MKLLIPLILLLVLTGCSTHSVKLGKKCTKLAEDNTYEKSFVWIINNENLDNFDQKINKQNYNFGNPAFSISSGNTDGKYGNFEYAPPSGYYALCTKRLAEFG